MKNIILPLAFHLIFIAISTIPAHTQDTNKELQPYGEEAYQVLLDLYRYDRHEPLNPVIPQTSDFGYYQRQKVVFTGHMNSRVPGYVAIPKQGAPPFPVVILLHAGASRKDNWWEAQGRGFEKGLALVDSLLTNGFAVVALDAEYHGERLINNDYLSLYEMYFDHKYFQKYKDLFIRSVIEYRRLLDYLEERADLDQTRVGLVGTSMGGMMGTALMALEENIKVGVLCSTPAQLEENSPLMFPIHHAPRIKNKPPILYIYGNKDPLVPEQDAQYLFDLLNTDLKKIEVLNCGHRPTPEYIPLTYEWIKKHLKP